LKLIELILKSLLSPTLITSPSQAQQQVATSWSPSQQAKSFINQKDEADPPQGKSLQKRMNRIRTKILKLQIWLGILEQLPYLLVELIK
jgi:hypothetical protein